MPLLFILRSEKIARTYERATYTVIVPIQNYVTRSTEVVNLQNFGTIKYIYTNGQNLNDKILNIKIQIKYEYLDTIQ